MINDKEKTNEDSAFGPGMMFGIPGPGPKKDTKGIPSDPKKERGIDIKNKKKMKNLLTFEDFVSENYIFEAQFGSQKVVIFPGRFQPFHNGHIAALKKCHDIFRLPVVPVQILSKTDKSPFDDGILMSIGQAVSKEFKWMAGYSLYPPGLKTVVPQMVKYLRAQYDFEPVGMGCGSDRLKAYEPQIKYLNSEKSDVPVSEPFRLEICDERAPGGPSGTKVREAIMAGDQKLFEQMTPKSVHKFYNELKKQLSNG